MELPTPPNRDPLRPLGDVLHQMAGDGELPSSTPTSSAPDVPPSSRRPPKPTLTNTPISNPSICPLCRDGGQVEATAEEAERYSLLVTGAYYGRVLAICPAGCAEGHARAWAWSGLPEEARGVRLASTALGKKIPAQQEAIGAVRKLLEAPRGWLTLAGGYGTGKTSLIYAALNHLADAGLYGRYTTAPDLLDWLRDAIGDVRGESPGGRLRQLRDAPVLAVDELDKYSATEFANEAVLKLFGTRYERRATHITLIGYNLDGAERIPPFLRSRIRDGRFRLVEMPGGDLRPSLSDPWGRGE